MNPKSPKWLNDITEACAFIAEVTTGAQPSDYAADQRMRYIVERSLEIIGEALLRLERADPATAAQISDYRQIIGLRNRLVHVYDDVNNQRVWEIIQNSLPVLHREARELLRLAEGG